jgi:hypothetical protein
MVTKLFKFTIPIALIAFAACKKMPTAEVNKAISTEESAHMIAGALASNTNGLNNLATDVTACSFKLYQKTTYPCRLSGGRLL